MDGNKFTKLESNVFQHLEKLQTLWFNGNKLEILDQTVFLGLGNLQELDLSCNNLTKLESFKHLKKLIS